MTHDWKDLLGPEPAPTPCDLEHGPQYLLGTDHRGEPILGCRCLVCARCGKHTGNTIQGHCRSLCSVTRTLRTDHFCCPGDCELEAT